MAISIHSYNDHGYRKTGDPNELPALLASGAKLWIDADAAEPELARLLCDVLKIHPLAVEDILQERMHPKVEEYENYLYVIVHGIVRDKADPEALETIEVDVVISEHWLFTHHLHQSRSIEAAVDELNRNPRILERGPAVMAHAILDRMIDYYLPVIDAFDDDVDEVEKAAIDNPTPAVLQRIFRLKRSLQRLRRIAVYQRDVLKRLSRGEFPQIPERVLPFFRDVHDHFSRVADLTDSYRELLSGALDAYLSVQSNRMNEIMKALTLVATVMLPVTFIAGVYGMNFEIMPELKWKYGYLFVWAIMLGVATSMVVWFKRKRWI